MFLNTISCIKKQINAINWVNIFASSSSPTTLEDSSAYATVPGNKFPATQVDYSGSGVITGQVSKSFGADFSLDVFKKAGFTITKETNSTFYYRKYVSLTGVYKLYR